MIRKCHCAGMVLVVSMGMLAGCSQAMTDAFFATSVADSRKFHKEAATALGEHDTNMGRQHTEMHPEAKEGIRRSQAEFEAQMVEVNKRFDQIHSSVGQIVNNLARRFAGLPAGDSIARVMDTVVGTQTGNVTTAMLARFNDVNSDMDDQAAMQKADIAAMKADIMRATEDRLA